MRHLLFPGIMLCLIFMSCSKMEFDDEMQIKELDLELRSPIALSFHARKTSFSEFTDPIDTSSSALWKIWSGIPVEQEFDFAMSLSGGGQFDLEISNMSYYSEQPEWDHKSNAVDRLTHDGVSIRLYGPSGNLISSSPAENSGYSMTEIASMLGSIQMVGLDEIIQDAESKGAVVKQSPDYTIITKNSDNPNFESDEALVFDNALEKMVINSVFDDSDRIDISTMNSYTRSGDLERISILDYEYLPDGDTEIRRSVWEISNFTLTL